MTTSASSGTGGAAGGDAKGRLLVALPALHDPNFDRTVVLILEHRDEGALGVVLNRPTRHELAGVLPKWEHLAAEPAVLFSGGPVGAGTAICLATISAAGGEPMPDATVLLPLVDGLGTVDLERDPGEVAGTVTALRIFTGHSGWGAGQLEAEIEAGAWVVVDATLEDVVSRGPKSLWRTVLRRQRGGLAMLAGYPKDPSLN